MPHYFVKIVNDMGHLDIDASSSFPENIINIVRDKIDSYFKDKYIHTFGCKVTGIVTFALKDNIPKILVISVGDNIINIEFQIHSYSELKTDTRWEESCCGFKNIPNQSIYSNLLLQHDHPIYNGLFQTTNFGGGMSAL